MNINWYPGHMAKTRRLMQEQLKAVDMVIEVVDARIPLASRNPDFETLFAGKTRMIVLNKADLAEEAANRRWMEYYARQGYCAIESVATNQKARGRVLKVIDETMGPKVRQLLEKKGVHKTIDVYKRQPLRSPKRLKRRKLLPSSRLKRRSKA